MDGGRAGTQCNPPGGSVEPVRYRTPPSDRSGSPGKHQKCGLQRIFRVVAISQDSTAHAKDQRPMARYHDGECSLIVALRESLQKLAVRRMGLAASMSHRPDVPENWCYVALRHIRARKRFLPIYLMQQMSRTNRKLLSFLNGRYAYAVCDFINFPLFQDRGCLAENP
jgi:hypothetical protein